MSEQDDHAKIPEPLCEEVPRTNPNENQHRDDSSLAKTQDDIEPGKNVEQNQTAPQESLHSTKTSDGLQFPPTFCPMPEDVKVPLECESFLKVL